MKTVNDNNSNSFIGKIKKSFSGRKFKSGAYATILSAIVIVIVLVVNLIVSKMNITFDLTQSSKYSITKETKDLIKGLKDDITIYYMIQQKTQYDELTDIEKTVQQYDKLSNKIAFVKKDPVLYPQFAAKYVDDQVSEGSLIVVDNKNGRAKYIPASDMVVTETDYQTYQTYTTGTDAEGKITSAILYVTNEDLPKLYAVQGHAEPELSASFTEAMGKMNVETQTLSTLTQSSIPEDCDILYINAPEKDFTDDETKIIKDYLTAGGNAIITADYKSSTLANFSSILDYYGIKMANGVVFEANADMMYPNYPTALLPNIDSHDITSKASASGIPVIMLDSSGLSISDTKRSSLTIEPLLTTSDSAYSKVNLESMDTTNKEDGDIAGPFNLGLAATDTYNGVTSKVIVYSSEATFSDDTAQFGNGDLLSGTIGFLSGNTSTVSIPAKQFGNTYIYPSPAQSVMWGAVTVFAIPLVILISGAVICLRRRKK